MSRNLQLTTEVVSRLPFPLAQAHLNIFAGGENWEAKARDLITYARLVLRYSALVVAADYARQDFKDEQLSFRLQRLKYPLDSDFPNLIEAGVPALKQYGTLFVPEMESSHEALTTQPVVIQRMGEKGFESATVALRKGVLDLRNAITHDGYVGRWQEFWHNHFPLVEHLVDAFAWLAAYPLLRPLDNEHWARLVGPGPDFLVEPIPEAVRTSFQAEAARAGASGIVLADARCERFMSLFPFMLWDECPYCDEDDAFQLANEAFMFNGEHGRRHAAYVGPHHSRPISGGPRQTASAIFEAKHVTPKTIRVKDLTYPDVLSRTAHQMTPWMEEARASLKYLDAVYQRRAEAEGHLERFMAGEKTGFMVVGEAGMGKSNLLARLVADLGERGEPVLAYPGYYLDVEEPIENYLLRDLQADGTLAELVQRLVATRVRIVVVVDGVNENQQDGARLLRKLCQFVTQCARAARSGGERTPPPIKVVMTMRTTSFDRALAELLPTGQDEGLLFPRDAFEVPWGPVADAAAQPRYVLDRLTNTELAEAYETYRRFEGRPDANGRRVRFATSTPYAELAPAMRELLAHPWFMRLALEVHDGQAMPVGVWAGELLRAYCDARIFGRTELERAAFAERAGIIVDLVALVRTHRRDTFSVDELAVLAPALHVRIEAARPSSPFLRLLEEGVLMEVAERRAFGLRSWTQVSIRFASDKLLEYLLAESLMKPWEEWSANALAELVAEGREFQSIAGALDVLLLEALAHNRGNLVVEALGLVADDGAAIAHGAHLLRALGSSRHDDLEYFATVIASTLPPARALAVLMTAGTKLADVYYLQESITCFRAMRVASRRVPETSHILERAAGLSAEARGLALLGRHVDAAAVQDEAIRVLQPAMTEQRPDVEMTLAWADACLIEASYLTACRRFEDAVAACMRISESLGGPGTRPQGPVLERLCEAQLRIVEIGLGAGQSPDILVTVAERAEEQFRGLEHEGDERVIARLADALASKAQVLVRVPRPAEGLASQTEAVSLLRGLYETDKDRHAHGLTTALVLHGEFLLLNEQLHAALKACQEAVELARTILKTHGVQVFGPSLAAALSGLGRVLGRLGRKTEAIDAHCEALDVLVQSTSAGHADLATTRAEILAQFALTLVEAGEPEQAAARYEEATSMLTLAVNEGQGKLAFPLIISQTGRFMAAASTGKWAAAADAVKTVAAQGRLYQRMASRLEKELRQKFLMLTAEAQTAVLDALGDRRDLLAPSESLLLKAYLLPVGNRRDAGDASLFEHVRDRAERGYPAALTDIAVATWEGELVSADPEFAIAMMHAAAAAGSPLAAFNLGQIHGSRGETAEATRWHALAAEDGDADAQYAYGLALETGRGVEPCMADALDWYNKAAQNGLASAAYRLGRCHLDCITGPGSFYTGVYWLLIAATGAYKPAIDLLIEHLPRIRRDANHGKADGMVALANLYCSGVGGSVDHRQMIELWRKAMSKRSGLAFANYSTLLYDNGDIAGCFQHTLKAAELGCEGVYFNLAMFYEDGIGTSRNAEKAMIWYKKAAIANDPNAFNCVAGLYERGIGVRRDAVAAASWYLRGAAHGSPASQYNIGRRYLTASGVEFDALAAFKWLSRAHDQKDGDAAYYLGLLYSEGENALRAAVGAPSVEPETFPRDPDEARIWFGLAAQAGNVEARAALTALPPRGSTSEHRSTALLAPSVTQGSSPARPSLAASDAALADSAGPLHYRLTVVAGTGSPGSLDGTGATAAFNTPTDVALMPDGTLVVADFRNHRLRQVTPEGVVSTLAGGREGTQDGPATAARFSLPYCLAPTPDGDVFIAEQGSEGIRQMTAGRHVRTHRRPHPVERSLGGRSIQVKDMSTVFSLAVGSDGSLHIVDDGPSIGVLATDGSLTWHDFGHMRTIGGLAVDDHGVVHTVLLSDEHGYAHVQALAPDGRVTWNRQRNTAEPIDRSWMYDQFHNAVSVAIDAQGNVFAADAMRNRIVKIRPDGWVQVILGGDAESTPLKRPHGICVDSAGNLYVADSDNHRICRLTPEPAAGGLEKDDVPPFRVLVDRLVTDGAPSRRTALVQELAAASGWAPPIEHLVEFQEEDAEELPHGVVHVHPDDPILRLAAPGDWVLAGSDPERLLEWELFELAVGEYVPRGFFVVNATHRPLFPPGAVPPRSEASAASVLRNGNPVEDSFEDEDEDEWEDEDGDDEAEGDFLILPIPAALAAAFQERWHPA